MVPRRQALRPSRSHHRPSELEPSEGYVRRVHRSFRDVPLVWWFIFLPAAWLLPYVLIWKLTGSELLAGFGGTAGAFSAVFGYLAWGPWVDDDD